MKDFITLLSMPILFVIRGVVLLQLWKWFIIPQFDVEPLTMPIALGISVIAGLLTHQNIGGKETDITTDLLMNLMTSLLSLLIGFIFTLFM